MLSYGVTDVGRRRAANQDSFIIDRRSPSTLLAVVCDGMGGAAGGLEASSIACSVFADSVEADLARLDERGRDVTPSLCKRILRRAVEFANAAVSRRAAEDPGLAGMGTTLVAALVSGERIYVANVGDSRLYSVTDGVAEQITHDHSYVQLLVDMGRITPDEARKNKNKNIITRAVGTVDELECDVFTVDALPDAILLCSDGLTNMLTPAEIGERFAGGIESEDDLTEICRSLVEAANEKGGPDNITAVAVAFGVADEEREDEELLPIESGALTTRIDEFDESDFMQDSVISNGDDSRGEDAVLGQDSEISSGDDSRGEDAVLGQDSEISNGDDSRGDSFAPIKDSETSGDSRGDSETSGGSREDSETSVVDGSRKDTAAPIEDGEIFEGGASHDENELPEDEATPDESEQAISSTPPDESESAVSSTPPDENESAVSSTSPDENESAVNSTSPDENESAVNSIPPDENEEAEEEKPKPKKGGKHDRKKKMSDQLRLPGMGFLTGRNKDRRKD